MADHGAEADMKGDAEEEEDPEGDEEDTEEGASNVAGGPNANVRIWFSSNCRARTQYIMCK
jgi:hypothetical protein